jgi:hypothetical protein
MARSVSIRIADEGIGESLMNHVAAWARDEQLAHLRLAPSPLSTSSYARLGFLPGAVVELDPPRQES